MRLRSALAAFALFLPVAAAAALGVDDPVGDEAIQGLVTGVCRDPAVDILRASVERTPDGALVARLTTGAAIRDPTCLGEAVTGSSPSPSVSFRLVDSVAGNGLGRLDASLLRGQAGSFACTAVFNENELGIGGECWPQGPTSAYAWTFPSSGTTWSLDGARLTVDAQTRGDLALGAPLLDDVPTFAFEP